jgi:hypothetical protein
MGTKLAGELLCNITGNLSHSVSTRLGVVLEGEVTVRRVVVVVTVVLWGGFRITERVVVGVHLEFDMNVDERDVGYDGAVSTTSRSIERNIRFDFGFVLAEARVPMAMGVHEIEVRTVTLKRPNLEEKYKYTRQAEPGGIPLGHTWRSPPSAQPHVGMAFSSSLAVSEAHLL